mmetsp:Transcript_890/g.1950  ORF Transcript_890/g.1950 Transcript_890/m.1950 type:complete len:141 (+) Transcript_890:119-541(+)
MQRPDYVDKATGQVFDTNAANFEGWLTKQSVWLKDWRRRYFILKGSKLFFAKSETTTPHGMIDLSACMTVKSAELKAGKRNAIEVSTADTTFFMYADTEKEKDEWIGAIGRAIVQASATFTTEDDRNSDNESEDSYNEGY